MNEVLAALEENQTWELTDLPHGKKPIGTKWKFETKYLPDGSVERYKARLVILGNKQIPSIDYSETFASVTKLTTFKVLLALASINKWHLALEETVYIKPPTGYVAPGISISVTNLELHSPSLKVCKLKKSLYELKQAPRQSFSKLSLALKSFGFSQSKNDYSLLTKHTTTSVTILLVYVDDLILGGNDLKDIHHTKQFLSSQFHMKDLGDLRYFLGIKVDINAASIFISQHKYLTDLI